ncbi:hypothetical protein K461DRAFT_313257 [Myriangium duriaei CBS 260.36]|uniref:Inheritance of peroxisomes protein 1 n=1 Tax=Myriangium duriaei CBS 260.36 TaxID=1168546 RepID=A0A9P4J351_9PEZI|nr:hypothetical protein K461DRAFT_313257 [Myriangium duriaei CBS 260.36]
MATSKMQPKPRLGSIGRMTVQRSVTVPAKLQTTESKASSVEIGATENIETLYVHPSARIISFTTSSFAAPSPVHRNSDTGSSGSLSWRSPTERTLASGLLEIYRVPGSVSFLHSGSLLHAILPRSQCWCVDGISVFTLRVLPNQYYRIELPGVTDEDLVLVEELKVTLQKVLHYERTACPFKRGFSVELPETPQTTPRRKSRVVSGPAKKWKLNGVWRPDNEDGWEPENASEKSCETESEEQQKDTQFSQDSSMVKKEEEEEEEEETDKNPQEPSWDSSDDSDLETPRPRRMSNLRSTRSVTAPPKLTLIASPPSKISIGTNPQSSGIADILSGDAEDESSAGLKEPEQILNNGETARPASKTSSEDISVDLQAALQSSLQDDCPPSAISQTTDIGIMSEDDTVEGHIWSGISTPSLSSDSEGHSWGEIVTPPETLRVKKNRNVPKVDTLSQRSVSRRGSRESQTALADGIMRKTVGIFLGPPAHLVSMMLKIASKISTGAFNFTIRSPMGTPQRVPGSWYLADDQDEWDIDDYGFPVGLPGSAQKRAIRNWTVD